MHIMAKKIASMCNSPARYKQYPRKNTAWCDVQSRNACTALLKGKGQKCEPHIHANTEACGCVMLSDSPSAYAWITWKTFVTSEPSLRGHVLRLHPPVFNKWDTVEKIVAIWYDNDGDPVPYRLVSLNQLFRTKVGTSTSEAKISIQITRWEICGYFGKVHNEEPWSCR